jgi:hypothetical protein
MQQELVAATEKLRVELQENATAAAEASAVLQERLAKTQASCVRLMNAVEDRENALSAPANVENPPLGASQRPPAASPKKKLKPRKKKATAPTDDELAMRARRAFNGAMQRMWGRTC